MPDRRIIRPGARALLVAALAAQLTGCGGDDGGEAATTTTEQAAATTSAPEATTTTVAAEGPPEWIEAVQEVNERELTLLSDPDPGRLQEVYAETCECWDDQLETVEYLADRGEHFEGEPATVLFVRHEAEIADAVHQLTVKARTNRLTRVDADGDLVQELPASEPSCMSIGLRADGPSGAWRVYSRTPLPQCPAGS